MALVLSLVIKLASKLCVPSLQSCSKIKLVHRRISLGVWLLLLPWPKMSLYTPATSSFYAASVPRKLQD